MKAVHPALTPEQFELALLAGGLTDDLGPAGRDDQFGHGLINAQKAVLTAIVLANGSSTDPGPILNASPNALNFGPLITSLEVDLENIGTGAIVISSVGATASWLNASPAAVDANGLGRYTLNVSRGGLPDGSYSGTVTFVSADPQINDVTVAVVMQVTFALRPGVVPKVRSKASRKPLLESKP